MTEETNPPTTAVRNAKVWAVVLGIFAGAGSHISTMPFWLVALACVVISLWGAWYSYLQAPETAQRYLPYIMALLALVSFMGAKYFASGYIIWAH